MREVNPKWRDRWTWHACSSTAYHVLCLCRPYLKLKREQADLIIEFYDENVNILKQSRARLSDKENERRAGVAARLHALNATGPPCQTPR
jgi:hypothetical protein